MQSLGWSHTNRRGANRRRRARRNPLAAMRQNRGTAWESARRCINLQGWRAWHSCLGTAQTGSSQLATTVPFEETVRGVKLYESSTRIKCNNPNKKTVLQQCSAENRMEGVLGRAWCRVFGCLRLESRITWAHPTKGDSISLCCLTQDVNYYEECPYRFDVALGGMFPGRGGGGGKCFITRVFC